MSDQFQEADAADYASEKDDSWVVFLLCWMVVMLLGMFSR